MTLLRRFAIAALIVMFSDRGFAASARGDANADGTVNSADIDYLAAHLLGDGPAPVRACLGDVNADAAITSADPIRLIDYLLAAGTPPPSQPTEVCNSLDDDCDGIIDNGFNLMADPNNCGTCANICVNPNGSTTCNGGVCTPICSFGWVSCDSNPNNGCEVNLNTNPPCNPPTSIGSVSGDTGGTIVHSGNGEAWLTARITENSNALINLSAQILLQSPSGADYDLYVYCSACGSPTGASATSGGQGESDSLYVEKDDSFFGGDGSFDIVIEVRYLGSTTTACGNWSLTVNGNVDLAGHSYMVCP